MEATTTAHPRPHRRHKTKLEIFKEAYLPYLILASSAGIIISFIIGAISG